MVGGIFLEDPKGAILWLDTGTGLIEKVANSRGEFDETVKSSPDLVEKWFLPDLVEQLLEAGKRPSEGQCYGYTILPVFAEGKYSVENMFVLPVREQFIACADIHRQLSNVPDGTKVEIQVVD